MCSAVWLACQPEGCLYPLQHDDEAEGSCHRKGKRHHVLELMSLNVFKYKDFIVLVHQI